MGQPRRRPSWHQIRFGDSAAGLGAAGRERRQRTGQRSGERHVVSRDPYQHVGQQDITCQVDFTSLMRLGDQHGLATVGYVLQSEFLTNLGFSTFLDALQTQGLSAARTELSRMALMTLVDSEEYGDYKVLAQVKGNGIGVELLGVGRQGACT